MSGKIIAVILIVVAISIFSYLVLTRLTGSPPPVSPVGPPEQAQENEEFAIPNYAGATETQLSEEMKTRLNIGTEVTSKAYITGADAVEVIAWYRQNMGGWELVDENSFEPEAGIRVYVQHFRHEDNGVFIFAIERRTSPPCLG